MLGYRLDSSAAHDSGYDPPRDADADDDDDDDDDDSGIAALLAIARHLRSPPPSLPAALHTVRCCFLNAEQPPSPGVRLRVLAEGRGRLDHGGGCCDMIALNSDDRRRLETHAGFSGPRVRDLDVPLAQVAADPAESRGEVDAAYGAAITRALSVALMRLAGRQARVGAGSGAGRAAPLRLWRTNS